MRRVRKGWTHHDGTNRADGSPNWCTCRARSDVPARLHDAILAAERIGGRPAAQTVVDGWRLDEKTDGRSAERITAAKKNYSPYSGIVRGVSADRLIVDDISAPSKPIDEEKAREWYMSVLHAGLTRNA